jgi:hypothetical protein
MEQLGINLVAILVAGTAVLAVQRMLYDRRRRHHLREDRPPVGVPDGTSL